MILTLAPFGAAQLRADAPDCGWCQTLWQHEADFGPNEKFTHGQPVASPGKYYATLLSTKASSMSIDGDHVSSPTCQQIGNDDERCTFEVSEPTTVKITVENGSSPSHILVEFGIDTRD
jgi:hypothetical protein